MEKSQRQTIQKSKWKKVESETNEKRELEKTGNVKSEKMER